MKETWKQGGREASARPSLQGGQQGERGADRGQRPARHILLGVSHASDDPTRHRLFEIRAVFDQTASGWVAQVAEQNRNEQAGSWMPDLMANGLRSHGFPTAAACLGDAVQTLVTLVDREA